MDINAFFDSIGYTSTTLGPFFWNGPGRSRHEYVWPEEKERLKSLLNAYRLFHSPAKDLSYTAANHI